MLNKENQILKGEITKCQKTLGKPSYIDDSTFKGGFRVVNTIAERDAIDCCHRKWGMEVTVVGPNLDFKRYSLRSRKCRDNVWELATQEVDVDISEDEVSLIEDYSDLEEGLTTQRDLNLILKNTLLQLYQQIEDLDIPTNTSDLINNGENGTDPFITVNDIPEVILPTNTSELTNDGEDGINPFITLQDIPVVTVPTKTSDLINDGEGIDPFITLAEVPAQTPQVKSDWNAISGPEEILNKPTIPVLVPQEQSDWNAVSGVSFIKNKPTIPAPVDISGKLDKPTVDGTWVVTKSGSTISYTDASTLGQNISNANLTWLVDRAQNLNGKKLSFTNGRFSVPTLEMEVTSSNSVPNKIWTDGVNEYYTNNAGINYKVGFDGDCTCVIITSVNISTSTLEAVTNKSQHGRNVILSNGVNAINLTCEITSDSKFVASYTKLGSAAITFTAGSGATLVQVDGTAILNGAVGSTACLTRSGNTFYLQISNR